MCERKKSNKHMRQTVMQKTTKEKQEKRKMILKFVFILLPNSTFNF